MHLLEKQKTISVHAETTEYTYCYRIVDGYIYTPPIVYINLYLPEKQVLHSACSFMYLAVVYAFEPVPFRKIM